MQSTLLGLGIAIILALVTALVGPYFVDWTAYRGTFEREASRLIGLPVRVSGAIDARILPTPSVRLRGIEVGPSGRKALQAQALGIEFGLGPLLRGELRAVEMRLIGPQFALGLDRNGAVDWPRPAGNFDPDAFAIEKLNIEDGRAILTDAKSGARLVLDKFWFTGEVRSLAGPFKGDGAFVTGNKLYGYRFSTGRRDADGAFKLRLGIDLKIGVDESKKPPSIVADGTLKQEHGAPLFEGTLTLARPVGKTPASGQTMLNEPLHVHASIKADPAAARMENVEIRYGPDQRPLKLIGSAEFKFGAHPRLSSVMKARQIDLDRIFATAGAAHRLPVATVKNAVMLLTHKLRPPVPVAIGIDVESMIVGGASLQTVRGDFGFDGKAWTLDKFELRAPGYTQAHFAGRLDAQPQGGAFTGRVEIDSTDPRALIAWLEGRSDATPGTIRPLRARGNVSLSAQTIAVEALRAQFDRESLEGRFAYSWPSGDRPARLDAELRAAKLDIDGVLDFVKTALAGTTLARPREIKLAVTIDQATVAGIVAQRVNARLHRDAKGLQIERLAVADLGGAAFEASGHLDTSGPSPRGTLTLDLDAQQLAGVTALIAKFAPQAETPFRRLAERFAPARLRATLNIAPSADGDATATVARLAANGTLAATRIDLRSEANGKLATWGAAKLSLDGRLESDDGKKLAALLGMGDVLAVGAGPGRFDLKANGALDDALDVDGQLVAGSLAVKAGGKLKLFDTKGVTGTLQVALTGADARPLRPSTVGRGAEALPVALSARVDLAGANIAIKDLSGRIADTPLSGSIALIAGTPIKIDGRITAETVDAGAVIASAIGMPLAGGTQREMAWSSAPFAAGIFADLDGQIAFNAARAVMAHVPTVMKLAGTVRFSRSALALENVTGTMAGGDFRGDFTVRRGIRGLTARTQIELSKVDAAAMLPAQAAPVLSGRVTLNLKTEGAGRSPQALIGSLAGSGTIELADARLLGVDPAAFAPVTQAVDRGLAVEPAKVRKVVGAAFDKGRLGFKRMESTITLSAGLAHLKEARARVDDAEIAIAGNLDLTDGGIDLRATLSGPTGAYASIAGRPDILVSFKGTAIKPQRSIDVSALVGWLTLRAVERQARRLQAVEANRRAAATEKVVRPASPVVRPSPHGALSEARRSRAAALPNAGEDRSAIDRLRPEPPRLAPELSLRGGAATKRSAPATVRAPSQAAPSIHQAPALPAPIEVTPLPTARRAPSPPRGRAATTATIPRTAPPARAKPAPRGPSLDELLLRPQN